MCGIAFSLTESASTAPNADFDRLVAAVSPRGPDHHATCSKAVTFDETTLQLRFHASVLHLRGDSIAKQPFEANGNVLIYNGEIFDGLDVDAHENDGQVLFAALQAGPSVLFTLRKIEGPYAFVYYEHANRSLYWARDPLGRRSLMQSRPNVQSRPNGSTRNISLTSVAPPGQDCWSEVETSCVFSLALDSWQETQHPRLHLMQAAGQPEAQVYPFDLLNTAVPKAEDLIRYDESGSLLSTPAFEAALHAFKEQLSVSVRKRIADVPRLRGPAYPAARVGVLFSGGLDCTVLALLAHRSLPADEAIDLLNVAFQNPRSVANATKLNGSAVPYSTPDRETGLASYQELCRLCPGRRWNFVHVNVPYAEFLNHRQHIIDLMRPSNTIMDLSIVQALWFAARGKGFLQEDEVLRAYISEARVLLSGLGADEQLGGYSRHRKAFVRWDAAEDWGRLIEELQMDLDRIGTRNLGRDDRVTSSLGKEVRYPYLAGPVIACLASLPVHLKMDHRRKAGGDKLLLRTLARRLGLEGTATLAKRAIQFGARSAKMEMDGSDAKGDAVLS